MATTTIPSTADLAAVLFASPLQGRAGGGRPPRRVRPPHALGAADGPVRLRSPGRLTRSGPATLPARSRSSPVRSRPGPLRVRVRVCFRSGSGRRPVAASRVSLNLFLVHRADQGVRAYPLPVFAAAVEPAGAPVRTFWWRQRVKGRERDDSSGDDQGPERRRSVVGRGV